MSHTFCRSATKFGSVGGLANRNLFTEFGELWSGGHVIQRGEKHQSFTDTLVKSFFDNFPMFADSLSVLSIHGVARGLGASLTSALHRAVLPCDNTAFLLVMSCKWKFWLTLILALALEDHQLTQG